MVWVSGEWWAAAVGWRLFVGWPRCISFRRPPSRVDCSMSESAMLRTFVAVSAPCPAPLARLIKELGQLGRALKCSSPRGLHCTLRFLGDTSAESVAGLGRAIADAVEDVPRFQANMIGTGAFPNVDRPNVVWAGLEAAELEALYERIDEAVSEFGYASERRPFHPHVTLARVKRRPPPELRTLIEQHADTSWGEIPIDAVELFKSTLTPAG